MIWVEIDHYEAGKAVHGRMMSHEIIGRPGYGGGWNVEDHIHEWLMDREPNYQLTWSEVRHGAWHVGFTDRNTAMLFKLMYGGQ